jgi:Fe2+ or Zn2+ uptake regulation protein
MRTLDDQIQLLRDAGFRLTRSRLAVLQVMAAADGVLDANAIHQLGRQHHPGLGRVSVYRALDLLSDLNLVRQVHGEEDCQGYARAEEAEGHYLICQRCGLVEEFPCPGLDDLLSSVARRSGFVVREHLLQLEGLCSACRPSS